MNDFISKKTELKRMLIVSNSFVDLTCLKNEMIMKYDPEQLIAVIVNCTFAIEVALKFLYYEKNDKKISGHNIKNIYEKVKNYGLEKYLLKDFKKEELGTILEQIDNAFVNFRYIYEYRETLKITPALLQDFTLFVNEYCNEYYKEKYDNKKD